ncbi:MAG: helix-turn-helix transcriptional regulator [Legionellaceae bacterium]|nr:helix-turn-helix transcriptional regulator [Legionellaceae bacterium]
MHRVLYVLQSIEFIFIPLAIMNLDRILKQYFSSANHVAEITKPLESIGVVGFFYARLYSDGSIANLTSQPEWSEHCFKQLLNGHYQAKDTADYCHQYPGISLSVLNPSNLVWQDAKNLFKYGNGISFCEDNESFREITCFYSTIDNEPINRVYINELDMLKKFKQYFVEQSSYLMQEANKNKVLLPKIILEEKTRLSKLEDPKSTFSSDILEKISISDEKLLNLDRKICVRHKKTKSPVYLSKQQSRCLMYLSQGQSSKEIARSMGLSPRTVDHYLSLMRKQLSCRSSKELIHSYGNQLL